MFIRKLGSAAHGSVSRCAAGSSCPDILELEDGAFAVIGTDITSTAKESLPSGSGCGPNERIVRIPRKTLVEARNDIPASM
jgi:hypothetical protein